MLRKVFCMAVVGALAAAQSALAIDDIETYSSAQAKRVKSVTVGRDQITLVDGRNQESTMPVSNVRWIKFGGEPNDLSDAKEQIRRNGKYAESLEALEKIKKDELGAKPEVAADHEFYIALCKAKLALVGKGQVRAARTALTNFIKNHPNHYTFYEANELLGDLARSEKDYAGALKAYNEMFKNKDLKTRATVLAGWTKLEQNQPDDAAKAFDIALADKSPDPATEAQRKLATLGKAACLVQTDKAAEAATMVEELIGKTAPEDLNARMFNVLGAAQAKNKQPTAAVLAYLHVDLMFPRDPVEHAEALGNLKALWGQIGQPQRGQEAAKRLAQLYPASRWAQP